MTDLQKQTQDNTVRLRSPVKYHVIMLNDNSTPMEFVVQILTVVFNKTYEQANAIMMEIHEKGQGVAGTYSFEVAEQKAIETISESRRAGFPLDVVVEEAE